MNHNSHFWDTLAPFHAEVEDSNFDLASVRRLMPEIRSPVLVVGAGHGLIVGELRKQGHQCDGLDSSTGMVQQAKLRRGIAVVQADAKAMPFPAASYETIIYATGVVDFCAAEDQIQAMLREGRRVLKETGKVFVAFYRVSAVQESFLATVGLLNNGELELRQSLELHLLNPIQMVSWLAKRTGQGRVRATMTFLRLSVLCTRDERRLTFRMRRIFRKLHDPRALIDAAPEKQPCRNQSDIENLFNRLGIPIKQFSTYSSCYVVQV
jgi:2-polyprenyl-3-methyl-5-hydroxy-6-metoxy-1,4-benzoquinol methylase